MVAVASTTRPNLVIGLVGSGFPSTFIPLPVPADDGWRCPR